MPYHTPCSPSVFRLVLLDWPHMHLSLVAAKLPTVFLYSSLQTPTVWSVLLRLSVLQMLGYGALFKLSNTKLLIHENVLLVLIKSRSDCLTCQHQMIDILTSYPLGVGDNRVDTRGDVRAMPRVREASVKNLTGIEGLCKA